MSDRNERLSIIVTAQDLASGKLSKVRSELAQMGRGGQIAAVGLGSGIKAVRTMEGAARHLGGVLGSLAGPVGLIGLTGAVFGLQQMLSSSIGNAVAFGEAVDKVRAITGESAQATSRLVDTLDYYGIKAEDQTRIVGMAEKNLGALTVTAKEAAKFQKLYGLSLTDGSGRVKSFNDLLVETAGFFNDQSIPAQTKAAGLAKIYGRNWQELIPILTKGSAAIQAAENDAIKLSGTDLDNMTKFKDATRAWDDSLGDLEVTVGAKLIPTLTDLSRQATTFLSGHSDDIVRFFEDGLQGAKSLAGFITGSVAPTVADLAGKAKGFWDSIPAPLRDMLVKGFIADRTINFLFGFSPGKLALGLLGDIAGPIVKTLIANRLVPQPVIVVNQGLNPTSLIPEVAGVAGAGLAATVTAVVAAAVVSTWAFLQTANGPNAGPGSFTPTVGSAFTGKPVNSKDFAGIDWTKVAHDLKDGGDHTTDAIENARRDATKKADRSYDAVEKLRGAITTATLSVAVVGPIHLSAADRAGIYGASAKARGINWKPGGAVSTSLGARFNYLGANHKGSDDAAVAAALATHFESGNTPLYKSSKNLEKTIGVLQKDQRQLLNHGDTKSAAKIAQAIARLQAEQARRTADAAAKTARASAIAGQVAAQAIRDKNLSVAVSTKVSISARDVVNSSTVYAIRSSGGYHDQGNGIGGS